MNLRFLIRRKLKSPSTEAAFPGDIGTAEPAVVYAGLSDKGTQRELNEDSYGVFPDNPEAYYAPKGQLFLVADGMGGHMAGKEASQSAIQIIQSAYFEDSCKDLSECLAKAFRKANSHILQESEKRDSLQKMGTTCSALVLAGKRAQIAHVGDSRIYRIRDDEIEQITQDHTEVANLIETGFLTIEEAQTYPRRSTVNRALGVESEIEIDLHKNISLQRGDFFILCTDGLSKTTPVEMKNIVLACPAQEACRKLIELSRQHGGGDNATVIVLKLGEDVS